MQLIFKRIHESAKKPLKEKLEIIGLESPSVPRIKGKILFLKKDGTFTFPINAIIDTGAYISLFPSSLLKDLEIHRKEEHTMWGVVDSIECRFSVVLTKVQVILQDDNNNLSHQVELPVAFCKNLEIPALIGMMGILNDHDFHFNSKKGIFTLEL